MMNEIAPAVEMGLASRHDQQSGATCPVCRGQSAEDFFHLPQLPVHVGVVYSTPEQARRAPMGCVTLTCCSNCGFVFNRDFELEKLIFEPGYEVQLVHSPVFATFLSETAQRLVRRYDLHEKDLLDVGCGAGHFLRLLCQLGENRGVGIDPTVVTPGAVEIPRGRMRLVRGLLGEHHISDQQFDFATCQSVLEDVVDPVLFLELLRKLVKARDGHVYLEVFNAMRAFEAGEVWSLTYEQCNYYSLDAFREAVRRAGFQLVDSGFCYADRQYLYAEATPARGACAAEPQRFQRPVAIIQFAQSYQQRLAQWQERIKVFRIRGQRAAVWGTGGKGICFLNSVGAEDVFPWAVDINPDRQNRYVPGSGQLIVSPAQLPTLRPDVIVFTNPLYESEIRSAAAQLHLNCDFMTI